MALTKTIYFTREGYPTDDRTKGEPKFVSEGAQRQDGSLKLMECVECGQEVVWATSKRTNRKYRVNVSKGASGARFYAKRNVHKCEEHKAYMASFSEVAEAANDAIRAERIAKYGE